MWKLAVWSRKGGPGKSTIALSLAVAASATYEKIALIDCDPQASIASWSRKRTSQQPLVLAASLARLGDALNAAATEGFTGAIIDMPGSLGPGEVKALGLVDYVLVPARPSPFDLVATLASIDVVKAANVPVVVVLSQVRARGREALDVRDVFARNAPVLAAEIGERVAFPNAISFGLGPTEYEPTGVAADEVRALLAEIRRTLNAA